MTTQHKNYIEPADFFRETLRSLIADEINDKLALMFMKLANKYANHQKFVRYHHIRDDLISTGIEACVKGFPKFRPMRNILERDAEGEIISSTRVEWNNKLTEYDYRINNNPFAFFTTCMHNDILQFLKHDYNERNICNKIRLENGLDADEGYMEMMRKKGEVVKEYARESENDEDSEFFNGIIW